jgi:NDP-sugar pyrophosphorylase family protein
MQVVILAAGRGKRMNGLCNEIPKPMLKIKGKPLLEYKVNALPREIKEIVFVVGYCGEYIMNHFRRYYQGRKITYVFQTTLNGTGGAIHLARSILQENFMVMMGDDLYLKKDMRNLLKHDLAVLAHPVDDISNFGAVKSTSRGSLIDIIEKPKTKKPGLANTGVYMLNKNFFNYDLVPVGKGEFGLPQTMATMTKDHKIKVEKASFWYPVSNVDDIKNAEKIIHKIK